VLGLALDVSEVARGGSLGRCHCCSFLDAGPEAEEGRGCTRGELVDPALLQLADRDRVQVVELRPTRLVGRDEPGRLEDPQVLHDTEPRHRERALDLAEALARTLEERVEDRPTCWVGKRPEHGLVARRGDR
jgi:hypothetical protein